MVCLARQPIPPPCHPDLYSLCVWLSQEEARKQDRKEKNKPANTCPPRVTHTARQVAASPPPTAPPAAAASPNWAAGGPAACAAGAVTSTAGASTRCGRAPTPSATTSAATGAGPTRGRRRTRRRRLWEEGLRRGRVREVGGETDGWGLRKRRDRGGRFVVGGGAQEGRRMGDCDVWVTMGVEAGVKCTLVVSTGGGGPTGTYQPGVRPTLVGHSAPRCRFSILLHFLSVVWFSVSLA